MVAPHPELHAHITGKLLAAAPKVVSLRGRERANAPYSFELKVAVDPSDDLVADESLLEAPILVTLVGGQGSRLLHGVILAIAAEPGVYQQRRLFRIRFGPRLALLKRRLYSRVFMDQSAVDIALALFQEHRVAHRLRLTQNHPKRVYTVQYHESDLAFLNRILAEAGIFYTFDHPSASGSSLATNMGSSEVVVLTDSARGYAPVEGRSSFVATTDALALEAPDHVLFDVTAARTPTISVALERAFDFQRPTVDLRDTAQAPSPGSSPHLAYAFGGSGDESPPELVAAQVRLEQDRRFAVRLTASSACRALSPGRTMSLEGAQLASLGTSYVVTSVEHTAYAGDATPPGAPLYQNRVELVPATTAIRPKRPRRRPRQVTETATVVGPPGKEIHVDALGRVQVQFHWDLAGKRDGRTSTWLRVAQGWAGAGWGVQILPRVGMEVVVTFLGGDLNRPLVTGAVYNATHPVPFPLPGQATKSGLRSESTPGGDGYHEISFDDAKGNELLFIHAQRNQKRVVRLDDQELVGQDQRQSIGRDRLGEVAKRDLLVVGEEHSVTVRSPSKTGSSMTDGAVSHTTGQASFGLAGGDAALNASGSASIKAGGDVGVTAGGTFKVEAGAISMHAGKIDLKADGDITITAGGTITIKGGDVIVVGATIKEN
jgi:type VI secretion system secreted protein VgrG